ncbi:MAG: TonB-dependent receptor [Flavobacteriaceae bacterium]
MKQIINICLLLWAAFLNAQSFTGKIVDTTGQTIVDAGVFNKTNGAHTHSNTVGNFALTPVKTGDSVYFSKLGYRAVWKVVDSADFQRRLNVVLEQADISLDQIVLFSRVNSLSSLVDVDLKTTPVKTSQEILGKVPGLIIGQHAGGGKAEQLFLRGFDIDHGTDVAISVDGLPVNMVSHAHGQGYADLHFVIPETIENLDFGKGPYFAQQGNFSTAGYVDLRLKKNLDQNLISLEAGQFNTSRLVGLFNVANTSKSQAYIGSEVYLTDGPFDSPQNFNRINLIGKYSGNLSVDQNLEVTVSHFQSKWDASGQIPVRAVERGLIGRFGAIDDTEGGETSRSNLMLDYSKQNGDAGIYKTKAWVSKYDFELYSNFTFFLENPVDGDQIRQKEERLLLGAQHSFEKTDLSLGDDLSWKYEAGIGFRYDNSDDNELSSTLNRQNILNRIAYGDIDELNSFGFFDSSFKTGRWMFNPALRLDYFNFTYENKLAPAYDCRSESITRLSPKLNAIYSLNPTWQFFFKTGIGFHSNDTRVVIAQEGEKVLPAAYGADLGTVVKPLDRLALNAALWYLELEQEFIYVGDAGIVEPGGRSRRYGFDLGARFQARDWLYLYADVNYAVARSVNEPDGADYIPLAPRLTSAGGLAVEGLYGFSGGMNYRFVEDRPANEDFSIVAEGYFITDLNVNYTYKNWTLTAIIENLFDREWKETQFATESRLFNEPESVEEIHFTPGTPFFIRGKISYRF